MINCKEHDVPMVRVEFDTYGKSGWECPECRKESTSIIDRAFNRADCEKATLSDFPHIDYSRGIPKGIFK